MHPQMLYRRRKNMFELIVFHHFRFILILECAIRFCICGTTSNPHQRAALRGRWLNVEPTMFLKIGNFASPIYKWHLVAACITSACRHCIQGKVLARNEALATLTIQPFCNLYFLSMIVFHSLYTSQLQG